MARMTLPLPLVGKQIVEFRRDRGGDSWCWCTLSARTVERLSFRLACLVPQERIRNTQWCRWRRRSTWRCSTSSSELYGCRGHGPSDDHAEFLGTTSTGTWPNLVHVQIGSRSHAFRCQQHVKTTTTTKNNKQQTTHNTQHTTHNTQHTTHNTQHTTHNTQQQTGPNRCA